MMLYEENAQPAVQGRYWSATQPLAQAFPGVSVSKQETMWEMLMKLDNNSSKGVWSTVWMYITITGWGNRKYSEGEEIRAENCTKNKNTELEKFQVTFSKSAGMHEAFITAHSSSFRHYEHKTQGARTEVLLAVIARSLSSNFYHATDCETKLMPRRKTPNEKRKKQSNPQTYLPARVLKFSKPNPVSVVPVSSESAFAYSFD